MQCAHFLARLHSASVSELGFREPTRNGSAVDSIVEFVNRHYSWWKEVTCEGSAEIECAYSWLMQHTQMVDGPHCVLHGDFDIRNFLIVDGRLNAVLDWELAHLGHPAEDLGYIRNTVEAILPWPQFLAAYRQAGGIEVSEEALRCCQVMGTSATACWPLPHSTPIAPASCPILLWLPRASPRCRWTC
jgi:aminoglycoside phosphotransferase (APT) family kinase protein